MNTGTDSLNKFVTDFIAPWLIAIGGVIALVGGIMFAFGWQTDNPENKTRGLTTVMCGFMVAGLGGGGYALFM